MKANTGTTLERDDATASPAWRRRASIALVGLLGLAACTSDPGPRRVAEDIVEGEFEQGSITESEKDCMLEVLDDYPDSVLGQITSDLGSSDATTASEGEDDLARFESDLAACRA